MVKYLINPELTPSYALRIGPVSWSSRYSKQKTCIVQRLPWRFNLFANFLLFVVVLAFFWERLSALQCRNPRRCCSLNLHSCNSANGSSRFFNLKGTQERRALFVEKNLSHGSGSKSLEIEWSICFCSGYQHSSYNQKHFVWLGRPLSIKTYHSFFI